MGIGKSLLGEIIGHQVGEANYAETDTDRLASKFNAHLESKSWILINELNIKYTAKEGWIKNLITRELNEIEHKGGGVYSVPNLRRYMMNSNLAAAMRLGKGNRRVWVCRPSLNDDELGEWKAWLEREVLVPWHRDRDCWLASCREWLEEVDISSYDSMADVINGEAAQDLIDASMTAVESAAISLIDQWEASGDEVLVIRSHTVKANKPVIDTFKGKVRGRGIISTTKLVNLKDGIREWLTIFGEFTEGAGDKGYIKNTKGMRVYVGNLPAQELITYAAKQVTMIVSAADHLK